MAAHRYWALSLLARAGSGNGVALAEVEMRASSGGPDLCVGGVASGTSFGAYVAANAFDNNNTTLFYNAATGGTRARLSYDFLSPVSVSEVRLRLGGSPLQGSNYGPVDCRVEWSDDGVAWTTCRGFYTGDLGNDAEITVSSIEDTPPTLKLVSPVPRALGSATPAASVKVVDATQRLRDIHFDGKGRVVGTVKEKSAPTNTPLHRRVRLFRERDGLLIRETWSNPETGAYAFTDIDETVKYTVVSYDYLLNHRAVVADNLTPELI